MSNNNSRNNGNYQSRKVWAGTSDFWSQQESCNLKPLTGPNGNVVFYENDGTFTHDSQMSAELNKCKPFRRN